MTLESARLRLLPYAPADLITLIEEPQRFAERFGYPVAAGVADHMTSDSVSPAWVALLRSAAAGGGAPDPWRFGFAVVHRASGQVIGNAGFKGAPDDGGVVEIAYAVAPAFEGQGYATEAAAALVDFATRDGRVRTIRAHTLPQEGASPRILRKCGFTHAGEVVDPEDGLVWRWERAARG